MSPTEEGFSSGSEVTITTGVGGVGLDGESRLDVEQDFFEGKRSTAMDLDWCLRCLSQNLALKLKVNSFSSSSSQIIGGTNRFSLASTSSLEDEEDKENEEDKADDEKGVASGEVLTFWTRRETNFFFF